MKKNIFTSDENCPVRRSLNLLGGKWTLLILFQINERVIRYGELKKAYPEIPPRVEYTLTNLGLKTLPIADTLTTFGLENLK